MRFLHLADLHLGWAPRNFERRKAVERAARRDGLLARAVDCALKEKLDLVVIAGDLFETHRPSDELVGRAVTQLGRLLSAGVQVVTVPGNHDEITYADSVYNLWKGRWPGVLVTNALPAHVTTLRVGGEAVHLYSLAYTGGVTPAREPLKDFPHCGEPGFHLAVFHGTLGSGDARSLPLDRGALERAGYDYVALGHIHQRSETPLGRTPVVYCGCAEGKGFDDPGVPHWAVGEVDGGRAKLSWLPCEVQCIAVETIDLTGIDSQEALEEAVERFVDADMMLRVRLTGSLHFPLDVGALERRFASRFYHFEVRDESTSIDESLLEAWAAQRTIQGVFVRRMRAHLDAATSEDEKRQAVLALRYGLQALRAQA
ncbi:MAG: DNA repair exonuclease [Deinococcota bacterium]|nr:DNA repair exonuclease [Deinococcota bacterium]